MRLRFGASGFLAAKLEVWQRPIIQSKDLIAHVPISTREDDNPGEPSTDPRVWQTFSTTRFGGVRGCSPRHLETQSLDRALELARTAEAFITGVGLKSHRQSAHCAPRK